MDSEPLLPFHLEYLRMRNQRPRSIRERRQDLPRPMADEDVALAIQLAPQPERAWISLAAFCGLRCMEIAALSRDVIELGSPATMRIYGKGGKVRIVPLPNRVLEELLDAGMPARGPLFQRMDGGPGGPSAGRVSERINRHLHSLGINHTAHTLRHRFGTALYGRTHDPFLVAQVMGHASVDTTRGYVALDQSGTASFVEAISALAVPASGLTP